MKKSIIIFFIFSILIFNIKEINAFSHLAPITLSHGLYTLKETNLTPNISYAVSNISSEKSIFIIIDTNQNIQELMRLEPNSVKYPLKPFRFGDSILIIGESKLEFS